MTEIKFLDYWWISDSEIDPSQASEDYFKVFYDDKGRYIVVERYDVAHNLQSHDEFYWDDLTLTKVEVYGTDEKMEKYIVYHYGSGGELIKRDHFSPEGQLMISEPADL